LAQYPVAWHALIDSRRHHSHADGNDLETRVRHIVNSDGGTKGLPGETRERIVTLVVTKLVSGDEGRADQRGTTDDAYARYVRRLARNIAKDLFRSDPRLLRSLIDKPLDTPLMFPVQESELPIDEKRLGRFSRRFKRLSYRDRFLLRLVVIESQTIAQIADQTKLSFAEATTRIFRLFARLRP